MTNPALKVSCAGSGERISGVLRNVAVLHVLLTLASFVLAVAAITFTRGTGDVAAA